MAFLAPLLEGVAPMLIGSFLTPTLSRLGTKFDQKVAPNDYGGRVSGRVGNNYKNDGIKKITTRGLRKQNNIYVKKSIGYGIMPEYGPAKGRKRRNFNNNIKGSKKLKGGMLTQLPISNDNLTSSNQQV